MDRKILRRRCFRHMLQLVIHSVFGLALFVPCIAHSASSNADQQAQQPASHFYRLPNLLQPQLSPSGKYLSARIAVDNQLGLLINDLDGAEDPILLGGGKGWKVNKTLWLSDESKLVSFEQPTNFGGTPVVVTRTMFVDTGSRETKTLFKREKGWGFRQIQDDILGGVFGKPGTFLISGNRQSNPKVASVFAVDGPRSRLPNKAIQRPRKNILSWQADRLGDVRVGYGFTNDQQTAVLNMKDATGVWHDVSALVERDAEVLALPTENPNLYFVLMLPAEADPTLDKNSLGMRHVYEFDVASGSERILFAATHTEVASITLDPKGEFIVLIRYQDEATAPRIYDPNIAEIYALLSDKYADANIYLESISRDSSRAVFTVNSPMVPGDLYLFDAKKRSLAAFGKKYPQIDESKLAQVFTVSYESRDGLPIPAYLTLPHGHSPDSARALPFVVLPHGGPHARDFRRFDWLAQMLAAAGYGVLQMNFRGSTGYGVDFERAGQGNWGKAMINDVTDGTNWLIAQGFADAKRLCIAGASFGGYAAMISAVREPRLYQCAVSLNGISDLRAVLRRMQKYIGGRYLTRHIGRLWKDDESLRRDSPINHIDNIRSPMLIVASADDRVVSPQESRGMFKALQGSSKPSEFIELAEGDHYLSRQDNRRIFSEAMLEFLHRHMKQNTVKVVGGD
jgi:dipeptidyl aminopeptidase/acylaminoacyl peptidase